MDYLNPQKEFRHNIILFLGYGFIAIAIAMTTLVLVYQAYGFGVAKNGEVTQSGLTFFSSQPNPAVITLNGVVNKAQTDTRLTLSEDTYKVAISRTGYQTWKRTIQVEGGSVRHYDYPFLVPTQLTPKKLSTFEAAPALSSQSLDRRWLVTMRSADASDFSVYDLKNPTKVATPIALPDTAYTKSTTPTQTWTALEWGDDNTHLLLQHVYDDKTEFVLLNRTNPDQSLNLTTNITSPFSAITLKNRKYDQYYLHTPSTGSLQTASIGTPAPTAVLNHVLAYKSYSDDTLLYATDADAPKGKVLIKLRVGDRSYLLRTVAAGTTYLLDLTKYENNLYVVLGASSENKLVIYKDPIGQLSNGTQRSLAPSQVLHVRLPSYVSFSTSAQFIMAENGTQFAVYDVLNDIGYNYTARQPIDAPALHATWMDGNRLTYVSNKNTVIFDYDYLNERTLVPAAGQYVCAFSPDYKYIYSIAPATGAQWNLLQTSLLTPADR